jgi:hypothetical protein
MSRSNAHDARRARSPSGPRNILAIRPSQILPRQNATLTTKLTKATKGSDIFDSRLRAPFGFAQGTLRAFVVKSVFSSLVEALPRRVSCGEKEFEYVTAEVPRTQRIKSEFRNSKIEVFKYLWLGFRPRAWCL